MKSAVTFALVAAVVAGCATAPPVTNDPHALWRMHTEHLAADRATIASCLATRTTQCEEVIQTGCTGAHGEEAQSATLDRICDWRAIAAWEDDMNESLAALRATGWAREVDRSQRAWERLMLDEVGTGMSIYEGGSLSGPVGAHIRARSTAHRAIYLRSIRALLEG